MAGLSRWMRYFALTLYLYSGCRAMIFPWMYEGWSNPYSSRPNSPRLSPPSNARRATETLSIVGRPTEQSSTSSQYTSDKAADGNNPSRSSSNPQCARTNVESNPWWRVDLTGEHCIGKIIITKQGNCCSLANAVVRAGTSANITANGVCGSPVSASQANSYSSRIEKECDTPLMARYVSVDIPSNAASLQLCEVRVEVLSHNLCTGASTPPLCAGGLQFQDRCYWFGRQAVTWAKADQSCRQHGTNTRLVAITNQEQQEWLSSIMPNRDLWIGLHDLPEEDSWQWVDDSHPNYTNWAPAKPSNSSDKSCAMISQPSSLWVDDSCRNHKQYACSSIPGNPICHSGGIFFRDRCYWFSDKRLTSDGAKDFCKEFGEGIRLVHIRDGEVNAFLNKLMEHQFWIGLHDIVRENQWQWMDGSKVIFKNWAPNEPNDHRTGEDCVEMLPQTGKWNDVTCRSSKISYAVCALSEPCITGESSEEEPCLSPYCSCVTGGSCVGNEACTCTEIFPGMVCDKANVEVQLNTTDQVDERGSIELMCYVNIPKIDYSLQVEHIRREDPYSSHELPEERTRYEKESMDNGYHQVVIYNATTEDTGAYVCIITTTAGVIPITRAASAYVTVTSAVITERPGDIKGPDSQAQTGSSSSDAGLTAAVAILAVCFALLVTTLVIVLILARQKRSVQFNRLVS